MNEETIDTEMVVIEEPYRRETYTREAYAVEREAYAVERAAYAVEREAGAACVRPAWERDPVWRRWHVLHELSTISASLDRAFARAENIAHLDTEAGEELLALQRSAVELHKNIDKFLKENWPGTTQDPAG